MSISIQLRLPFDWKTPIGYAVALLLTIGMFMLICHVIVCALGILIAYFGMMMKFGQNTERKFYEFNVNFNNSKNETKIRDEIVDAIRFHSNIKEFCIDFFIF